MGSSITRLTGGGLFVAPPPPQSWGTTRQIYKIQTSFDRSGKFVVGNLMLLNSGSPMTSQVKSKSKCLDDMAYLVLLCTTAISNENKSIQRHGTCLGHLCIILSFRWAYSRSRIKVTRSRKGQTENCMLWQHDTYFRSVFRQERQKWPNTFWMVQIRQNLKIVKIQKSQGRAWKMGIFDLQNTSTPSFLRISTWNFVYIYT